MSCGKYGKYINIKHTQDFKYDTECVCKAAFTLSRL